MSSYSPPPPPPRDQSMDTEAPNAPITRERRLNPDLQEQLPKPCTRLSITSLLPIAYI
jgi:peroxygenase